MIVTKNKLIAVAVILYLLSTGLSFGVMKAFGSKSNSTAGIISPTMVTPEGSKFKIDPSIPRDQVCPLNGKMYTKQEKDIWVTRRPLMVMIENHKEARPQSGLSSTDIIYEAVAEGGITRFLAVFYCDASAADVQVGPVRSARTYFLDFASEYGDKPLYVHVGGANSDGPADALGQIEDYGWAGVNDLNQFSIGFPTFWRDQDRFGREVATEHTMYSTTEKLWAYASKKRGLTNVDKKGNSWDAEYVSYEFKDDASVSGRPANFSLGFFFWPGYDDYSVKWNYDKSTNAYTRFHGGQPHMDMNDKTPLTTKNLVLLFMNETNANDGYENNAHLLYRDKGTGKAVVYLDGKKITAQWQKTNRTSRLKITDATSGEEIIFNRGRIWFEILPTGTKIEEN